VRKIRYAIEFFHQRLDAKSREVANDRNELFGSTVFVLHHGVADAGLVGKIFCRVGEERGKSLLAFQGFDEGFDGLRENRILRAGGDISSASPASTARISARSAEARCAPPVQTAIFRSRGARPRRRSSRTSVLRVSTGLWPQVLLTKHHCTGGAGRAEGGMALPFNSSNTRRSPGGHLELLIGRKVTRLPGRQLGVEKKFAVREDADTRAAEVETERSRGAAAEDCSADPDEVEPD